MRDIRFVVNNTVEYPGPVYGQMKQQPPKLNKCINSF